MEPHMNGLLGEPEKKLNDVDSYDWIWSNCTEAIEWFSLELEEDEDNLEPLIDKRLERRRKKRELKEMRALSRNEEITDYLLRGENGNGLDMGATNTTVEILSSPKDKGIVPSWTMLPFILTKEEKENEEPLMNKRIKRQKCERELNEMSAVSMNKENITSLIGYDKENGESLEHTNSFEEILDNLKSMRIGSSETFSPSILNLEEKYKTSGIENLYHMIANKNHMPLNDIMDRNPVKAGENIINLNTEKNNEIPLKNKGFQSLQATPELLAVAYDGESVQENSRKNIKSVEYNQSYKEQNSSSFLQHDMSLAHLTKSSMIIGRNFHVVQINDTKDDKNLNFLSDPSKTSGILGGETNLWGHPLIDICPSKIQPSEDESTNFFDNYKEWAWKRRRTNMSETRCSTESMQKIEWEMS